MMFFKWLVRIWIYLAISNVLANDKLSISTAFDFSKGRYGEKTQTEMTATVIQTKYVTNAFSFQIDLPYLTLSKSTGNREGIGDVVLGTVYNVFYHPDFALAVDVGFKLKIPTASRHDGLGTGETDESLQIYAYKSLDDVTLMFGIGYKWVGQPDNSDYRNVVSGSTGIIYQLSERSSVGTLVDFRQSVFSTLNNQTEITLYNAYKFSSSWRTQLYVYKGVTNSSPSIGFGGSLNYQF